MKVLMAARKPTSSSNMTSTCGSHQLHINPGWARLIYCLTSIKLQVWKAQEAKILTSSNRMRDVTVILLSDMVSSRHGDGLLNLSPSAFSDGGRQPKCKGSTLAFVLKKLASVTAAGWVVPLRPQRPLLCPDLFFEVELMILADTLFPVERKSWKKYKSQQYKLIFTEQI